MSISDVADAREALKILKRDHNQYGHLKSLQDIECHDYKPLKNEPQIMYFWDGDY